MRVHGGRWLAGFVCLMLIVTLVSCGGRAKPDPDKIAKICNKHQHKIDKINRLIDRHGEKILERIKQRAPQKIVFLIEECLDRGDDQPDVPEIQPTQVNRTTPTSFFESNQFLFQGEDPVQTGVDSGTMEFKRMSVVRGRVINRSGEPVAGATVKVLNHPEFGQTVSRADGRFDMAVNGGEQLTVSASHDDFLPVQRPLDVGWRDFTLADTMVMTPLDSEVTTVDLTEDQSIQMHRASVESDMDGERQATLLFKPGTEAVVENSVTGETDPLSSLDVRATEYTIGETGPQAMPAPLPPTSGYTYAAELSTSQTIGENTDGDSVFQSIKFNQPVVYYLENFLGVPAGVPVPVGVLDRNTGNWEPRSDGWVIEVVSESGGQANVDVNGDGTADRGDTLARFGIDAAERQQLASLYDPGQSLWRVPMSSFSPVDFNYPVAAEDSEAPSNPEAENCGGKTEDSENSEETGCSRIEIQNQILGENVDLVGVPFDLHYRSERAPGFVPPRQLEIPLSGETIPEEVEWIRLEVYVAGQSYVDTFPAEPNQSTTFTWNGRDAYGRLVQGKKPISINIGFVYDAAFYRLPGYTLEQARTTLLAGGFESFTLITRQGEVLFRLPPGEEARGPRSRVTIWQRYGRMIGNVDRDAFPVGAWSLGVHHVYDPEGNILFKGNGRRRSGEFGSASIIETIAGNGEEGATGDRGPATDAAIGIPHDVVAAPDGSFYLADPENNVVRKVFPDGRITTFAGGGNGPPLARRRLFPTDVALDKPIDLALDAQGRLLIAERKGHRISRVDESGRFIRVVAGNGDRGFRGDSGPAIRAELNNPSGVDVAPDGTIYIADRKNHKIRRITTDGDIHTVAGEIAPGFAGDGGIARQALLDDPKDVDVGPDGRVFVADSDNNRIRVITPDGDINTVVGGGSRQMGSGVSTEEVFLFDPVDLKVRKNGDIFFNSGTGSFGPGVGKQVWKATPDGFIVRVAGQDPGGGGKIGLVCSLGDGGPATQGELNDVFGISITPEGDLLLADGMNHRIREVSSTYPGVRLGERFVASLSGRRVFIFDGSGRHLRTVDVRTGTDIWRFDYNDQGDLVGINDRDGLTMTIERDDQGTPQAIVAPFGQRTTLEGESRVLRGELGTPREGETLERFFLTGVTNPADETHQMVYSSSGVTTESDGLLREFTKPGGQATTFDYNEEGRLVREEDPAGGFQEFERAEFDTGYTVTRTSAMGRQDQYNVKNLPSENREMNNKRFDGLPVQRLRETDGHEHIEPPNNMHIEIEQCPDPQFGMMTRNRGTIEVETPFGRLFHFEKDRAVTTGETIAVKTLSDTFRINGREWVQKFESTKRQKITISPEGRQQTVTLNDKARRSRIDQAGLLPIEFDYNVNGRLVETSQGDRTSTRTYNANGFLASITDPVGRTTSFEYDQAGRVTTKTLQDGRQIGFQYDNNGNLTALTPPGRNTHVFRYTSRDQQQEYEPPSLPSGSTITTWTYNLDRQLIQIQRPDMTTVNFAYDDAGRRSSVNFPSDQHTMEYNSSTGNLTSLQSTNGPDLSFSYEGSLPTKIQWNGTNVNGWLSIAYDDSFRVTQQNINGNRFFFLDYDRDGLLTQAGDIALNHDPANGLLTGSSLGNVQTSWSHNGFGEVVSRTTEHNGSSLYSANMQRDTGGRIVGLSEKVSGKDTDTHVRSFEYDEVGRLVEVNHGTGGTITYQYDTNGNRTARTGSGVEQTDFQYDAQDRLISFRKNGDTLVEFSYTANGELQSKTVGGQASTTYDYDAMGNLRSVTLQEDTTIEYLIDGKNRRVGKRINGNFKQGFLYQDQLNPVAELGENGDVESVFIYGAKDNVPSYMIRNGTKYRIISNHIGSVRMVVNSSNGNVVQRMKYDAFGRVIEDSNPGFQPFGFAGGIYDHHTGLVRFGARDYDPTVGRWTVKDPLLFDGGITNLYGYGINDPINFVDPNGKDFLNFDVCVGVGPFGCIGTEIGDEGINVTARGGAGAGFDVDLSYSTKDLPESDLNVEGTVKGEFRTPLGELGLGIESFIGGNDADVKLKSTVGAFEGELRIDCEKGFGTAATAQLGPFEGTVERFLGEEAEFSGSFAPGAGGEARVSISGGGRYRVFDF